jgi:hypothetical protein
MSTPKRFLRARARCVFAISLIEEAICKRSVQKNVPMDVKPCEALACLNDRG